MGFLFVCLFFLVVVYLNRTLLLRDKYTFFHFFLPSFLTFQYFPHNTKQGDKLSRGTLMLRILQWSYFSVSSAKEE